MSDFASAVAERTLRDALQMLIARWPTLDAVSAADIRAALTSPYEQLRQATGRFLPVTAAVAALGALDQAPSGRRLLAVILDPARETNAMRGIAFSDPDLAREILAMLEQILQITHDSKPNPVSQPSYWPDKAKNILRPVIEALLAGRDRLDAAVQADLGRLFLETARRLEEAATFEERGAAAVWFLEQIDVIAPDVPEVPPLLQKAARQADESAEPTWRKGVLPDRNTSELVDLLRRAGAADREMATAMPPDDEPSDADEVAVVQRYGAVEFPGRVLHRLATRLTVRLTEQQARGAISTPTAMSVQVGAEHPVTAVVLAPDFVIFDANWNLAHTGELVVKASGDSDPLFFELLPKSPGAKSVAVDFRQNDRLLGTVGLQVEVVSTVAELGAAPAQALSTQAVMTMPDRDLPPPQLELRIKAADSAHTTFEFILHSRLAGFNWKSMGTHTFAGQPAEEMKSYFKDLNELARQTGGSLPDEDRQTELKTLGENLFFDAFPEALQRALWAMPARITSLIITSDEPWIPWELARIFDPETRAEGDFLCSRFTVARWLAGDGMTATLPNREMTAIIPSTNLIYTAAEYEALQELWPDDTLIALTDAAATTRDVISRLKDSRLAGIVHVASHGAAGDDPAQSTITLSDGKLRPTDISRSTRYTRRPLIFFNACESGRTGFALAGLGGWAERFVQAGAGAFVGALWEVNDRLAAQFAAVFYEKLFGGAALGDAFTAARTAIRDAAPNNPTWLAYVLYGEPLSLLQAAPE
ncbi:MAG: CHAT domain-containing protein [Anaerolineae bacterium]